MAIDKTQIETDLDNLIAEDAKTVVSGASTASCSISRLTKERAYSEYGFSDNYRISITCPKSDIAVIPVKGATLTVGGTTYQVLDTEIDGLEIALIIHLGEAVA